MNHETTLTKATILVLIVVLILQAVRFYLLLM